MHCPGMIVRCDKEVRRKRALINRRLFCYCYTYAKRQKLEKQYETLYRCIDTTDTHVFMYPGQVYIFREKVSIPELGSSES